MNFQIFFGFIVVCYICYYLGIVAYDLMVNSKRAASEDDKAQDETVDISDEVREFTPILITRPIIKKQKAAALKRKQTSQMLMTGGIEVERLVPKVEELSQNGEQSELGGLLQDWKETSDKQQDSS
ncbi:hypothetical protein KZO74_11140 [Prevotella salivae]|jgi:hypothetical protein|uniref:Uncharacterized protein n=1 Tax=Segatella maculosa OT 289 TaxID=999422 RepID=H1HN00_9BACT|nr:MULTISPECIES: hypothetical protein [Prevotellaceae]DAS41037.1 MAG TPA: hypothetical protein [Caudoviricetes sp.]EHO69687.1 hypothetical protein HMPREF9944_01544 [Segatella maculosa OT 289]ELX67578.1 hypothetical protein HMPREF0662_01181 [Prevotella nigrescens F0103]MBF1388729.1 hypothetical protein [Prevotella denticola]MBF1542877.1 hypothetical protein [Segatella salivae]